MCIYKQIIFNVKSETNYFCNCIVNLLDLYSFTDEYIYDGIIYFLQKIVSFILEINYFDIEIKIIINSSVMIKNNYDLIINLKENIITYLDFKFIGYYEDFCKINNIHNISDPEYNDKAINICDEIMDSINRFEKLRKIIIFVKNNFNYHKDLIKELNIKLVNQKCRLYRYQNYSKFNVDLYCNKIFINIQDDFIEKSIYITDKNSNIIGSYYLYCSCDEHILHYNSIDVELFEILNDIIDWKYY